MHVHVYVHVTVYVTLCDKEISQGHPTHNGDAVSGMVGEVKGHSRWPFSETQRQQVVCGDHMTWTTGHMTCRVCNDYIISYHKRTL